MWNAASLCPKVGTTMLQFESKEREKIIDRVELSYVYPSPMQCRGPSHEPIRVDPFEK